MATSTERQRRFAERQLEQGFTKVSGYVPAKQAAEVRQLLIMLYNNPHLELGTLRDTTTGRFVKVKG